MSRSCLAAASTAGFLLLCSVLPNSWGNPGFFDTSCAGCHYNVPPTCNGCHPHGVRTAPERREINLSGTTDKTSYGAGETVIVTVGGGNQSGWVRVTLYDEKMEELAQSSGPAGVGGGLGLPLSLSAPAPEKSGTYSWTVGWYGSRGVSGDENIVPRWLPDPENPGHGEELVATNTFTVLAGPEPTIQLDPGFVDFGAVSAGMAASRAVKVVNTGNALLSITDITRCPDTGSEVTWSPSFLLVAPGANELLQVTFDPVGSTSLRGCLRLVTNDPETPVMLLLLGSVSSGPVE